VPESGFLVLLGFVLFGLALVVRRRRVGTREKSPK
jgi:hypothetical protein